MNRVVTAFALAIFIIAGVGAAYAAYTSQISARGEVSTGSVQVELLLTRIDEDGKEIPVPKDGEIVPGMTVSRIARGRNIGSHAFYIRAKVGEADEGRFLLEGTDQNWVYKDGYWYYAKPLEPGQTTEPLLTAVRVNDEAGNEDAGEKLKFRIELQATQTDNNGSSAMDAKGWPADE